MVDFNHRRLIQAVSAEGKRRRGRRRRKGRTWRSDAALPIPIPRPQASWCFAGRIFDNRGKKKTTCGLLAEALQGDFFSLRMLLGEKMFILPTWGEELSPRVGRRNKATARFAIPYRTAQYARYAPIRERTGMHDTAQYLSVSCVGMLGTTDS
ncbi:hypothetical protein BHE74_00004280 [Ensete ventricosum]|nr:hypothetical protein GW17_00007288 [Ensete ventricosum]RWW86924.1 hypothetical protein BHE74_00004280 [Ensete ventricosum]